MSSSVVAVEVKCCDGHVGVVANVVNQMSSIKVENVECRKYDVVRDAEYEEECMIRERTKIERKGHKRHQRLCSQVCR